MSYYDDEFYNEPSEFEMQIDEFKKSLLDSVKEEFKQRLEKLEKENNELQEVKANFLAIKQESENHKRALEYEYQQLKANVRKERLSELMKDYQVELYSVTSRSKSQPKCDKCDGKRRIYYTTPLGKETYEVCGCAEPIRVYEPIKTILTEFTIRNGKASVYYKVKTDRYDEWLSYYEDSISGNKLITNESQFDDITYSYSSLFSTEELAQKYCDYKNNKEV